MLALVTGATGCIGRNLVDELVKDRWDVIVLHRKSSDLSRLQGCPVRFQEVDLYDLESVRSAIPQSADCIFHVAGNTSHWRFEADQQWKDNVLSTRNLLQGARDKNVKRFVFTSTGATTDYQDLDATGALKIKSGYVRTKRLAEIEVYKAIENGLDAVILKPIIVVGPYDYNGYSQMFTVLKKGPLRTAFPGKIAFCHAVDVARGHIQAFEKGKRGEHYFMGGTHATWEEASRIICDLLGVPPPVVVPKWILKIVSFGMEMAAYVTKKKPLLTPELIDLLKDAPDVPPDEKLKAERDLGYHSRPLRVMFEDCYQWLLNEKRI